MTKYIFTLVLIFCVSFHQKSYAKAEPVELSLSTMILFAMDKDPDLLMALEREKQIGFFKEEAVSGFYPQVQFTSEGGHEYVEPASGANPNNLSKASITLNQKLFDGFSTRAEVDRRTELIESAVQDVNKEKEDLILEVTEYYLDILRFQNVVKSTEAFVVEIDKVVDTIQELYEGGAVGKAMFDYAKSRQAAAYVELNESRSSLNDGLSNLQFLTGPLPAFAAKAPDQFSPDNISKNIYIEKMGEENSLIQKNQAELRAMEYQLKSEKGQYYPQIELNMKAEQTHNDGGDSGRARDLKGTVNLSYSIFDGFNKDNRMKRVRSQIDELEYRDLKIYEELKKDINLSYNQISAIRKSIKSTNQEISANRALQSLNRENFKLGTINVIELIEGEERLSGAYNKKYRLQQELYQGTYNLLVTTAVLEDKFFCETCDQVRQAKN